MNERLDIAMDEWLCNYKKNSVKPATYNRLRVSYDMMLRYMISAKDVQAVTTTDIQKYLNRLADEGYALSTIKKQFTLLTAFLKHEYAQGEIKNPIYLAVKLPVEEIVKKPAKKIEIYSQIEQHKLTKVLNTLDDRLYGAAILMLETGMRVGETLALTWDDIDWDRRAVSIEKTLVRLSGAANDVFVQASPKSKSSRRTIPLSNRALDVLERLSESTRGSNYIFYDARNHTRPCTYDQLRFRLQTACKRAGVPYRGNHAFRHTFATNCYHRGCNVNILSKLLGHADVSITYNIYIHLYGNDLEEMRNVIG